MARLVFLKIYIPVFFFLCVCMCFMCVCVVGWGWGGVREGKKTIS